ncbi:SOS response-associated peptidase [Novosphingobium album (ex Hu et al. 2023)]|uniref:Abasic site processing protein n=1 Tax=Novosphingobium album (ex Hu et al. 2023) TaxID=2930093 RepID=A0ABT0B6X7_9SPHN|nr:SOS response-associated peptidase family protein [Novosphingobium album (ex Hu et al. 2023)]MCJ2180831.1 SOS response-associated peptidase family protein [Novosphingobium album (ex Hu et al. 2023)]
MCNLYRMTAPREAVSTLFGADPGAPANFAGEVYPGYPGLVVAEGALCAMTWGFPLVLRSRKTGQPLKPKPVNNAREDKLATAFWRDSFVNRRCLVPVSAWAEADGEKGRMTRTWFSLPDAALFAVAGIWRPTDAWGQAYSMVMVDGCERMGDANDRMPTILRPEHWRQWVEGTPEEAFALCRTWDGPLDVERTSEPWAKPRAGVLF